KVGDVSNVVKTQFGYHIIKLTGEQRGLEFFRHSIKWQIAQEKQKDRADKMFQTLRDKASVKIYEGALAKVTVASPPPQGNMPNMGGPNMGGTMPAMPPGQQGATTSAPPSQSPPSN